MKCFQSESCARDGGVSDSDVRNIAHTPHGPHRSPASDNNVGGFNFITLNQLTGLQTHTLGDSVCACVYLWGVNRRHSDVKRDEKQYIFYESRN